MLPTSVPPKFRSWGPTSKCDSSGPQQSLFIWTTWPIFSASLNPVYCSGASVLASLGYKIYCCLYWVRFQAQLEGRVTATWPALWPAAPNLLRSDSCWLIPHLNKLLIALEFLEQLTALECVHPSMLIILAFRNVLVLGFLSGCDVQIDFYKLPSNWKACFPVCFKPAFIHTGNTRYSAMFLLATIKLSLSEHASRIS